MSVSQPTATTTTWTVDASHSLAEFAVRHLMISSVKGRFGKIEGTFTLDEANLSASKVALTIDASSVDTSDATRDTHLRSADFFEVEKYPTITFVSTRVEPKGDAYLVTGDLTMHGVTRSVTARVEADGEGKDPWGNDRRGFSGEAKIDRKEWNLAWNTPLETGGLLLSDEVKISIAVEVVKQK